MEDNTLLWIGQTLFYMLLFFLLLIVSRLIFKFRDKRIDIDNELTTKDNGAYAIATTGYFVAILIVFAGVIQGDSHGIYKDAFLIAFYGLLGNVLLVLSSIINEKIIFAKAFHFNKEIIRDENNGAGYIEAANFIASSLIIYGAISGSALQLFPDLGEIGLLLSGSISVFGFWAVGQVVLAIILKCYTKFSSYNVYTEIEKDNVAVGMVYASVIIAIAFLYGQAIKGDIESWALTLENIAYYLGLGLIILPISRFVVDKIILPKSSLTHEISRQDIPNTGVALIEAFAYIGSAVLISVCI